MKTTRSAILVFLCACRVFAQTATLTGKVTDESGALVPTAKVTANGPGGLIKTATTGGDGEYALTDLVPSSWSVMASAPTLAMPQPVLKRLGPGIQRLDLRLK